MDEDELVHELVNSLAFEVEAIPTDNIIKFTSTNGTPLNVKVRVRNKDEPRLIQRGIVSVPKLGKHIASVDKIRIISSDQTILSFNVYMETELDKQNPPKNRKHGFKFFKLGGCLGTSYDEDEGPYLPGPSGKKGLRSRTSSKSDSDIHTENMGVTEKLKLDLKTSKTINREQKKLFGKCKPGGCLDPPFGEDKEPYRPSSAQKPVSKVEDRKEDEKTSIYSIEPGKSTKASTKSLKKESNKDLIETKPMLDIYARPVSLEHSPTSNYSSATIRSPSKMSSSKMLDTRKKNSQTYDDDSLRQSYQYPEKYFIPPKDIFQNNEEERRYSRERSNDQIRPTTTRRENDYQTRNIPHIHDVSNAIYPESVDAKSPQTTKLSKQKGKDNTERIKQTLTDLTCNEIDNASKPSESYRENSKISLNVPLVAQKLGTTSSYKETPQADITYIKNLDEFDIPIAPDDLDLSIISKYDPDKSKNKKEESRDRNIEEYNQYVTPTKSKETIEISLKGKPITDKVYEPENKFLSKDMRNKNVLKSDEPMESENINAAKPILKKLENSDISSTPVSGEDEVNILQLVPPTETQKVPQTDHLTCNFNGKLEDKPTKTSDKIEKATDSQLSPSLANDKTKLLMMVRLSSLENVLDIDDTNGKNNTEVKLKHNGENEKRGTNMYPNTAKYVDNIQNLPSRETFQEQIYESQELKDNKPMKEDHNLLVSGLNDVKIKNSLRTAESPKDQVSNPNLLVSDVDHDKINKILKTGKIPNKQINGNKNIQDERIQDSQVSTKLEPDMVQKPINEVSAVKDSERKTLQGLDINIIHSETSNNLPGVETHDKIIEEKLPNLKLRNSPSKDVEVNDEIQSKPDLISNQKQIQNTMPPETFHKQILDRQYRKIEGNGTINEVPNSTAKSDIMETYSDQPINKHIAKISDMTDVSLNGEDYNTIKIKDTYHISKTTSENLEKFDKQVKDSKYTKSIENDNKVTTFDKAFDSDDKKQPLTASIADSGQIKRLPIDKIKEQNQLSKTTSENLETIDKELQDSKYTKNIENDNKVISFKNAFDSEDKKQPLTASIADSGQIKRLPIDKIKEQNELSKTTSENLEKNDKEVQDSKYTKDIKNNNQVTSFENAFDSDDKKHDQVIRQPIDTNIINYKKSPIRNSSHDNILSTDIEFSTSSTNSTETNNLNYDYNEKVHSNVNRTDNDNVIITNTSLNDRNKNLTINTQDTIPSDILHKPPLVRTEDTDLPSDDINVIKPFKRNTFTIVASSTSLEKQEEEPVSIQQIPYTTDEQFKAKTEKKLASNDQTTTDLEHFTQNDQQNSNDSKHETIKTDPFLNISTKSDTSLKIDDRSRGSYSETENQSKYLEPSDNQTTDSIKIKSNTSYDDKLKTTNYVKSYLASDVASNDVNIVDNEILKSQDQTDNKLYIKEKLILKNLPDTLVKQISELQDRSDDDIEHLQTELKIHNNDKIVNNFLSDNFIDTTTDNTSTQITHSQLLDNDLNNKISISNISMKETEGVSMAGLTRETEKKVYKEKVASIGDEKSDTNYAPNAVEYRSRLLELSKGKLDHELGEPKNIPVDISQSIVSGEPDEYSSKLFPEVKSGKIVDENVELDTQSIHTNDQNVTIAEGDNKVGEQMDLGPVRSVNKVIDTNSLILEDYARYYSENNTSTGNLRKLSDSGTTRNFDKIIDENLLNPEDSTIYYSKYDQDTKNDGHGGLKNKSESFSTESFNKDIGKTSIVSKDGTKYHSQYDNSTKVSENGDLRKISKQDSVGNFNEVIDENPLMEKYDIAHIIEDHKITKAYVDGVIGRQFDANTIGRSDKVIDEQPLASKDSVGYFIESALPLKVPISAENLSNIGQFEAKKQLDVKQNKEQNDSIGLEQGLGVEIKERLYSQNENILNKIDLKGRISSPLHKSKSEVLILNLALQSYVNDNNDTVVQTISPMVEPVRYIDDNITVVQSLIRHGHEIRIPVDVENDLSLKFTTKTNHDLQNFNTDQNRSKKGRLSRNLSEHAHHHPEDINNSLAFIYERELIPLHNVIKNLTEEINILTTQQEQLKDKMRGAKKTKSLRLIPVNRQCGCGRM